MDIEQIIVNEFTQHPFEIIPDDADYQVILSNYLAMSQAFPYLQAGSQKDLFLKYMFNNQDIPEELELTTIVGNFLCWDETGGLNLTLASGLKNLPRLLETRRFHSNLLKKDCATIFSQEIHPDYSDVTRKYLLKLFDGLSHPVHAVRTACMVSFEIHADKMITALWGSLANHFNIEKDKLSYFMTHVGGDDPAEPYHVAMTARLIEKIVAEQQHEAFIAKVKSFYQLHVDWCQDVVNVGMQGFYYKEAV